MATLATLETLAYNILREEQDSSAYPLTFVDTLLNSAQSRICRGTVINPMNGQAVRKGKLSFLDTSAFYSNVNVTTLSADAVIGGNTLSADTTNYPSSGAIYVNGDIITYTGKTSTQFTGVTGIQFAHLAGSQVSIIFSLPTNYSSLTNITYANSFKLTPKLYDDIWEDLNGVKGQFRTDAQGYRSRATIDPFYTIIGDYFLIFNRNNTGDQIHVRYEKKPTTMALNTDTATIPDEDAPVIAYLAI
ncbi:hypothetical protein EKK58_11585 [Candidatus Dependentiae bacterium]|nr:MAG: hypothetical protein EKK58_11585 [Candidatus Dependentiae bacterium]